MRALKLPYPAPERLRINGVDVRLARPEGSVLDFPDRGVSYAIYDCNAGDLERGAAAVREALLAHPPGTEPKRLELRLDEPR